MTLAGIPAQSMALVVLQDTAYITDRIHELVDAPNWVVGAFIPEAIFEGGR